MFHFEKRDKINQISPQLPSICSIYKHISAQLTGVLFCYFTLLLPAQGALTPATNLLMDAKEARQKNIPILLLFSLEDCPYCHFVKKEVITPMSVLKEYQDKVIVRVIEVDDDKTFYDFYHRARHPKKFAFDYNVNFYPTVVIVDYFGNSLIANTIGVINEEFYWYELDIKIDKSQTIFAKQLKASL